MTETLPMATPALAPALVALILVPLAGGLAAWIAARRSPAAARWLALGSMAVELAGALALWVGAGPAGAAAAGGGWIAYAAWDWIPRLGVGLRLGVDGVSLLLVALTAVLGILAVACSWSEITERVGFFHFNLLWILAGVVGVFLALDLLLFYFFWELMLVPMAFLIGIWGHENRVYAAIKFFLFTQASGLLMLVAILGLWAAHGAATGTYTFDYFALLETPLARGAATWLMWGFFVAFAVKLPAVPLHTWLPDAHTEAPTAGSVVLAGLLLKTGGYGLIRFAVPLFPDAAREFAPAALALGALGVLYGAWVAFAQTDLKRLVAYTSVSHLGFVLLGVYAFNQLALQGAMLQMVCHGLSTGALFILVGQLQERTHTRDLERLGGLWDRAPRMAGLGLFFALASLGLPGLGNFVAEFLVLVGAWRASVPWTAAAAVGLVLATVYSLSIVQRVFHGEDSEGWELPDLNLREVAILALAVAGLLWLGLYPRPAIELAAPSLESTRGFVDQEPPAAVGDGTDQEGEGADHERQRDQVEKRRTEERTAVLEAGRSPRPEAETTERSGKGRQPRDRGAKLKAVGAPSGRILGDPRLAGGLLSELALPPSPFSLYPARGGSEIVPGLLPATRLRHPSSPLYPASSAPSLPGATVPETAAPPATPSLDPGPEPLVFTGPPPLPELASRRPTSPIPSRLSSLRLSPPREARS